MDEEEETKRPVEFEDWPELDRMGAMVERMSADRPYVAEEKTSPKEGKTRKKRMKKSK